MALFNVDFVGRSKVAERVVGVVPKKAVSKKNKSATSRGLSSILPCFCLTTYVDKLTRGAGKPKSSSLAKPTLVNSGTVPLKHTGPTNVVHATEINTNVSGIYFSCGCCTLSMIDVFIQTMRPLSRRYLRLLANPKSVNK